MENSNPCKIVTPENFILKLGTRNYVDKVTYYTIFDVDRFSGGFPEAYLHAQFHLDPPNRLATIRQRYRQDRTDVQTDNGPIA